jgi:hypothetical protein
MVNVVLISLISTAFWFGLDYLITPGSVKSWFRKYTFIRNSEGFYVHGVVHHVVVALGAFAVFRIETDPSVVGEPDRSFMCLPPVTPLSEILPAISFGYGFHDVVDGLRRGLPSFVIHGLLLVFGFGFTLFLGVAHHMVRILMINASSIFLNMRRLDGGSQFNFAIDMMFVFSFVVLRIIILPLWWIQFLYRARSSNPDTWGDCMNKHIVMLSFLGGIILHGLNMFWFYLIVRNACRRYRTSSIKRKTVGVTSSSRT